MKAVAGRPTKSLNIGSLLEACDNSGARIVKIVSVKKGKTKKGRQGYAKIADWVKVSVRKGDPKMKGEVFDAVIVRQKKQYRRLNGQRICFEDNAAVVLKDDKGNPKGTMIKGPVAKEACDRWPGIAKIASIII